MGNILKDQNYSIGQQAIAQSENAISQQPVDQLENHQHIDNNRNTIVQQAVAETENQKSPQLVDEFNNNILSHFLIELGRGEE